MARLGAIGREKMEIKLFLFKILVTPFIAQVASGDSLLIPIM